MNDSRKRYKVRHILLEDLDDAHYILEKLEAGESFEAMAAQFSECDSAAQGGLLPVFSSGQMEGAFERAVYHLEVDQVSAPVKTKYGYHLIKRLR